MLEVQIGEVCEFIRAYGNVKLIKVFKSNKWPGYHYDVQAPGSKGPPYILGCGSRSDMGRILSAARAIVKEEGKHG